VISHEWRGGQRISVLNFHSDARAGIVGHAYFNTKYVRAKTKLSYSATYNQTTKHHTVWTVLNSNWKIVQAGTKSIYGAPVFILGSPCGVRFSQYLLFCLVFCRPLWNQSLNSDGQQLDQYQQSAQWSLTLTHWTQKDHDIWRPGLGQAQKYGRVKPLSVFVPFYLVILLSVFSDLRLLIGIVKHFFILKYNMLMTKQIILSEVPN
jgi:hypothetical protein